MKSNQVPDLKGCSGCSRREAMILAGLSAVSWLTPAARLLAMAEERSRFQMRARSLILLWMAGGPSQLETFDPHPGKKIAAGSRTINTSVRGIQIGAGLEQTAALMEHMALVRSVISKEADHERAVYNIKTGYRPNPTVVHPSIGAVICHEFDDPGFDIPRHISILPDQWPAKGGYLGAQHDAFLVSDPKGPVQDIAARVPTERVDRRMRDLTVLEQTFAKGRPSNLDTSHTFHQLSMKRALKIMSSAQLDAFDVMKAPGSERFAYGDTSFGRACLAAVRLVESGVRCVEITLSGWDTHVNNHALHRDKIKVLDPAFAALLHDLKRRGLLDSTVVLCGGEFGRSPKLNALEGRDHWPYGFSMALAGGGIRGGQVIGATDPEGESRLPQAPVGVEDIHATIQHALGINPGRELRTPVGRPLALSDGRIIRELLAENS